MKKKCYTNAKNSLLEFATVWFSRENYFSLDQIDLGVTRRITTREGVSAAPRPSSVEIAYGKSV
jgi:hypothetical protein